MKVQETFTVKVKGLEYKLRAGGCFFSTGDGANDAVLEALYGPEYRTKLKTIYGHEPRRGSWPEWDSALTNTAEKYDAFTDKIRETLLWDAANLGKVSVTDQNYVKGAQVIPGKDWKWLGQDRGIGILLPLLEEDGWCRVQWSDGYENSYRIGVDGAFDLYYASAFQDDTASPVPAALPGKWYCVVTAKSMQKMSEWRKAVSSRFGSHDLCLNHYIGPHRDGSMYSTGRGYYLSHDHTLITEEQWEEWVYKPWLSARANALGVTEKKAEEMRAFHVPKKWYCEIPEEYLSEMRDWRLAHSKPVCTWDCIHPSQQLLGTHPDGSFYGESHEFMRRQGCTEITPDQWYEYIYLPWSNPRPQPDPYSPTPAIFDPEDEEIYHLTPIPRLTPVKLWEPE